jgi:hypothetical protein
MSYSVAYDPQAGVVAASFRGGITISLVQACATEIMRVAKGNDCYLVLTDAREGRIELSVMDIYDLPNILSRIAAVEGVRIGRFKRAAIVYNDLEDFAFFETVSRNRGQSVVLFHEVAEAKKWLSGG